MGWTLYHMCTLDYTVLSKLEILKDFNGLEFDLSNRYSLELNDLFLK